ncbi:hypothetical protein [Limnohabitans sp. JirII-29]|uniref:N-acyl amino acid synthase FeeM domain-containing protein n=1 Tax=Limnohabitans sp. JirII-29 TaxID=1835756 RepID=UPI0011B1D5F3|nr:hypothetical protein [Limnohabitans sp. JirII-29]
MKAISFDTPKRIEYLPFQVKVAREDVLPRVVQLRAAAYGHHLPELGARLATAESADYEAGCLVICATSRMDDEVLGSMRIHTNAHRPLPLESSLELPEHYTGLRLCEATRLSVGRSPNSSVVRNALFKAFYLFTMQQEIDWMVVTGRSPVDRIYDGLLFEDVLEKNTFYPMHHVANLPHRVMSFAPPEAQALWKAKEHPLYRFVFETHHPDIDVTHESVFHPESFIASLPPMHHQPERRHAFPFI